MAYDLSAGELAPFDPSVHGTEKRLIIYYDETNNVRKLLLTDNGFNVSRYDNFVLGGVALNEEADVICLDDLRNILRIQSSASEIKFDLVAKGDFERVLESKKLTNFFKWLLSRKIKIHYTNMNILHWSILDIIESIVANDCFSNYIPFHRELKNELHRIVVRNVLDFLALLKSFDYPNIDRSTTSYFIKEIRGFVEKNTSPNQNQATFILKDLLLNAQSLPELAFLVDETPNHLINGFQNIFLNRIARFKNSVHVFDEEPTIQSAIDGIRIMDGDKPVNFSFADSKLVPGIQLSDVVTGFLGKYFTFIERTSPSVLIQKKNNLTSVQRENLKLFKELTDQSDTFSNGLLFKITTLDSEWKADYFLFGRKLPPHLKPN
ncbi:DUF3800 domain-containing protein [Xanthomonas nasturtii]|uniref:DUF3800 domain-containing protein n=1 Tax=Xanthomonas nasturtii TaxID=1843581 RepID=A0ABT0LV17_9XANT|nr:DUF3800 domain-containing protein [Xanthomonas nasturtii]MCL1553166.1 DUF3800 domain-containing protein [Xanthomonas nasturtii]MCL1556592.1 DUF3800 domain-containing protein [Xanthomonas nasturtii]